MRKLKRFLCGDLFPFALLLCLLLALGAFLSVRLPMLLRPIAAVERLFALTAVLVVTADGSPPEYKLSKAVLVLLLPWVGAALCFLFLFREKKRNYCRKTSFFCTLKAAEYFPVGREMYLRLLPDLKRAKSSIYLEFYIIAEGIFFSDVLEILSSRAAAGVDVRILYDGFGCALTLPSSFEDEMRRRGIAARCFRPLRFPSRTAGKRDHRKIVAIDGKIAYTGGINLADEYIGEQIRFGHWKDTALRITGDAAARFSALFLAAWNGENEAKIAESPSSGDGTPCAVVADTGGEGTGRQMLLRLIAGARERLYLTTPYLAPDAALMGALGSAAAAGVDVRLMIPHIPDKKWPFLLTRSYARELERGGVKVMEYTDGFLHAKSVVSDNVAFVSSYNLDFRSLYLQAECGIAVKSKTLSDKLAADFLGVWAGGTALPATGVAKEFFSRLLRLTAPLI